MVCSPGMSVATSASRILSPSVDLARLMASAITISPMNWREVRVVEVLARLGLEHGVDLADHRPLGGEIEREGAARDHAFELVADRVIERLFREAGVLGDDGVRLVAELGHGLDQQDAVGGVARRHQHVGIGRLQLLHLRRQRRRVGAVLDVGHDLVAALARELELRVAESVPKMVSSWNSAKVSILVPFFFMRIEEVEHRGREHLVMGRGAEIEFQAAAMQARRGIVGRQMKGIW